MVYLWKEFFHNIDTDNAIDSTTDTEQQYTIPQKENSAESASQKEE